MRILVAGMPGSRTLGIVAPLRRVIQKPAMHERWRQVRNSVEFLWRSYDLWNLNEHWLKVKEICADVLRTGKVFNSRYHIWHHTRKEHFSHMLWVTIKQIIPALVRIDTAPCISAIRAVDIPWTPGPGEVYFSRSIARHAMFNTYGVLPFTPSLSLNTLKLDHSQWTIMFSHHIELVALPVSGHYTISAHIDMFTLT